MHPLEDGEVLLIRCPVGLTEKPLALIPAVAPVLARFDGQHSVDHLVELFAEQGLSKKLVQELRSMLDEHLFLESPRFFEEKEKILKNFREQSLRPASRAGLVYAADAEKLTRELDAYLGEDIFPMPEDPMDCFMAPHIDYRRGGKTYGRGFRMIREADADVYILIGTSHQYSELLFHLSPKDFDSPLGVAKNSTKFTTELAALYGVERSFQDEILHKQEHSLELQVPFLKHVQPEAEIVPILVGSFYEMLRDAREPYEYPVYNDFVEALIEVIGKEEKKGKKISFLAGVDMAHVGQNFGDRTPLSDSFLAEVRRRDEEYLNHLADGEKSKLFTHIQEDLDARRICGFPTMYTILDVFDRLGRKQELQLFDYDQAVDLKSDCCVSFSSGAFYRKEAS